MARTIQSDPLFSCKPQTGRIPAGFGSKGGRTMKLSMEKRYAQAAEKIKENRKDY